MNFVVKAYNSSTSASTFEKKVRAKQNNTFQAPQLGGFHQPAGKLDKAGGAKKNGLYSFKDDHAHLSAEEGPKRVLSQQEIYGALQACKGNYESLAAFLQS